VFHAFIHAPHEPLMEISGMVRETRTMASTSEASG